MKRRKFLQLFSLAPLALLVPKVFANKTKSISASVTGTPIKNIDGMTAVHIPENSNTGPYVNLTNSSGDGGYFVPQKIAEKLQRDAFKQFSIR